MDYFKRILFIIAGLFVAFVMSGMMLGLVSFGAIRYWPGGGIIPWKILNGVAIVLALFVGYIVYSLLSKKYD